MKLINLFFILCPCMRADAHKNTRISIKNIPKPPTIGEVVEALKDTGEM